MPAANVTGSVGMPPACGVRDPINTGIRNFNGPVRSVGKVGRQERARCRKAGLGPVSGRTQAGSIFPFSLVDSSLCLAYLRPVSTHHNRVLKGATQAKELSEMAFKPLHDRVLVRRVEGDEKTKGGLIIPDSAKEKPAEGEVVAVGAGAKDDDGDRIAMDVKAGDRILFGKWSGTEITLDGQELLIMKESDILGVIE
jgi:chaperonin GroES